MPYEREQLERDGLDALTVEPWEGDGQTFWLVRAHGEYGDSSVLAGSYRRVSLEAYATLEEALAAYPWAEVIGGSSPLPAACMSPVPPAWFDPGDAGETW